MRTPRDKFQNDPAYHELVCLLESFIDKAHFTPSELREAAILASINHEMRNIRPIEYRNDRVEDAFKTLDSFLSKKHR